MKCQNESYNIARSFLYIFQYHFRLSKILPCLSMKFLHIITARSIGGEFYKRYSQQLRQEWDKKQTIRSNTKTTKKLRLELLGRLTFKRWNNAYIPKHKNSKWIQSHIAHLKPTWLIHNLCCRFQDSRVAYNFLDHFASFANIHVFVLYS